MYIRVYNLTSISRWVSNLTEGCSLHMEISRHCPEVLHLINRQCSATSWINVTMPAPGDVMVLWWHLLTRAFPAPSLRSPVRGAEPAAASSWHWTVLAALAVQGLGWDPWHTSKADVELMGADWICKATVWVELVPGWPGIMGIYVFI